MSTAEFLDTLTQQGVNLWIEGDQLRYRAPKGVLTSNLRTELAKRKPEVVALLRQHTEVETEAQLPRIQPAPEERQLPFPLTDMQHAYWIGRSSSFEIGNVAGHAYIEIESADMDVGRLNNAWQQMIDRHDALRLVVDAGGQQRILADVPAYSIEAVDWRGGAHVEVESGLNDLRHCMSHQVLPVDEWPLFDIRVSLFDDRRARIHISIDGMVADAWSLSIILKEWGQFYRHPGVSPAPLEISLRDYVLAEIDLRDSKRYQRSLAYWKNQLIDLPLAPDLPMAKSPASITRPRFVGHVKWVPPETWQRLKTRAARAGLTPSGLLLAVYARVLATWSKSQRFTISVPHFNRLPMHPQVDGIVGELASFIPVEVDFSTPSPFEVQARRIQQQLMVGLEHQCVSGVRILRELAKVHGRTPSAMLPVVFTTTIYQSSHSHGSLFDAATGLGQLLYNINQTPQVWADFQVSEREGALRMYWEAVEEIFPPGLLEDAFDAYVRLVQRLADEDEAWQDARLQLVPPEQMAQWEVINGKRAPIPDKLLHTLFEEQVARRPGKMAVVSGQQRLTYEALDQWSNQVGRELRGLGVRPNQLVAVVMEKGWEQIVAVLGIHKAGGAYLPMDANLPRERIWYLLEDGQVEVALTQPWLDRRLTWPEGVQRIVVNEARTEIDAGSLEPVQGMDDLAYVIYTSGSTGQPKGAMITQRGLVNGIVYTNKQFGLTSTDRTLALTALHHDMSAYDIFGTLAGGGAIVVPDAAATRDPAHWVELINREQVTIWNSVPPFMEMLVEYLEHADSIALRPDTLRLAFLGGDWIPLTLPDRVRALAPSIQVVSVGGPTETTLWNIWYPVGRVDPDWKSIPYGQPIVNTRYYVLNEALELCPVWVPGEMYCAGVGLARGYWRNEEKTRASFITHPGTGERLYRTGDLGRYLPDGNIEFLGRGDFQVKIQGQRIELGEIEAALIQNQAVKSAVVMAVGELRGRKHLVGYVVPSAGDRLNSSEIRNDLKEKLPEHMIPSFFVTLDSPPLTPNGKVDRRALSELDLGDQVRKERVPARGPVEGQLAAILADLLGGVSVGAYDNFFELGGDSVMAVQIVSRVRDTFQVELSLPRLFEEPTVASLALEVAKGQAREADVALVAQLLDELENTSEDEVKVLLES
jgi:pyochelin synthetase